MKSAEVYKEVLSTLNDKKMIYEEISHEPVYHMEEAAVICGHEPDKGVKVLFFRSYSSKNNFDYGIAVWQGTSPVDFKKVAEMTGSKKISLASPNEVVEQLGIEIGSLSPFGYDKYLPVVFDEALTDNDFVYINAGRHDRTVKMKPSDLIKILSESGKPFIRIKTNE